jgi:diguanylate cyclase (GGDEF)-like protein
VEQGGSEATQREQFRRALTSLQRLNLVALIAAIPFIGVVHRWIGMTAIPFACWLVLSMSVNRWQAYSVRRSLRRVNGPWDVVQRDIRVFDGLSFLVSLFFACPSIVAIAVDAPDEKWLLACMCVLGTVGANIGIGYGRIASFHIAILPMAASVGISAILYGGQLGLVVFIGSTIFGIATVMTNDQFCRIVRESISLRLQLEAANVELVDKAETDELTQLPNRIALKAEFERQTSDTRAVTGWVLFLDLDGFKEINDVYGHETGDLVLQTVADRLRTNLRPGDRAFRLGGDEFLVVVDKVHGHHQISARLQQAIGAPMELGDVTISVGVSIGAAPVGERTLPEAIAEADRLMYSEKATARSRRVQERTPTVALP